jgi:hypothetical protein
LPRPEALIYTAPWHLEGPDGLTMDGTGYMDYWYVYVGEYTVTWGEVAGYITPEPETITVEFNQFYSFWGYYTEIVE